MASELINESEVDVLIIGAGPAGLFAGNALARAGVNVKIIDRRPDRVPAGQADGIQPRTIEVLQSYGLADRLLKEGNQMHTAAFYNPSPNGGIELTERSADAAPPTARYPFEITLHQGAIESIFLDSLAQCNVKVMRPYTPIGIELSKDNERLKDPHARVLKVELRNLDAKEGRAETEIVHAKFVIGADGAHSWVRKVFGIAMEGEQTEYIWGVVDFTPETNFPDIRNKSAIHSANGSCMIIPREGDKVRLYIQLSDKDAIDQASKRVDKSKVKPYQLLEVARKIIMPYTFEDLKAIDWWTIYIIGQRVASKYSIKERVFIVGDACHTHSPKAGQGMNASMNDSHNLAWKMAHVLRGWADKELLKTYEQERRKYAQDLINFDKKFSKLFSGKPQTEDLQDGVSHEEFIRAFQTHMDFTSGIGIHYSPSTIVHIGNQSEAKNLTIGKRVIPQVFLRAADGRPYEIQDLLPSDMRFKILVFVGDSMKPEQQPKLNNVAKEMNDILMKYAPSGEVSKAFDILSISTSKKEVIRYNQLPRLLRPHWSKVLIDDMDLTNRFGGDGYKSYGIDDEKGAIVVVRPDGYVGTVLALEGIAGLDSYFGSFMIRA